MIKKVNFIPEYIAKTIEPAPNMAIISITEPGRLAKLKEGWKQKLRLQFHDTDGQDVTLTSFNTQQAINVIKFLEICKQDKDIDTIIVHCFAGISRSAAIALFIHENYTNNRYKLLGTSRHNALVRSKLEWALHERTEYKR